MPTLRQVPWLVAILLVADFVFVLAHLIVLMGDLQSWKLQQLVNLDSETSLPSWYSSIQWCCAAALFAAFALSCHANGGRGAFAVAALALLFLIFSADEIVGMHEWLGRKSDALLPEGTREGTAIWKTGMWPVVIGVPVIIVLTVIVIKIRVAFTASPGAFVLLVIGLVTMFAGALLTESLSNLIDPSRTPAMVFVQLATEELLEMVGVTLIVWSGYEALREHGMGLRFDSQPPIRQSR